MKHYFIFVVLLALLSGCSSGSSDNTNANTPTNNSPNYTSTPAIISYMNTTYSNDQISLSANLQSASRGYAAGGYNCSGNEIIGIANVKESMVQSFLTSSISFISQTKSSSPIDKVTLAGEFQTFQAQDVAWTIPLTSCGYTATQLATMTGITGVIDGYYTTALSQLNSL